MRKAAAWLADSLRFPGALFYWNGRKSWFVWRRRRDRCPCQNPSDDSVPGRVRCDAILHWRDPARFRSICPLLVQTPEGWRCSVHASAVRPFWGRAARWCLVAGLALYLGGASAAWVGLRLASRAPLGWLQLVLPWRWDEIRPTQAAHLFSQAMESFAHGRPSEARLALATVRDLDPRNYDAGLMLAQISMFERSYLFADDLFMQLWREHPDRRERTAVTYHDSLLALDRMGKLAEFSVTMAAADTPRAVVWVRSALIAARSLRPDEAAAFADAHAGILAALAPHAQSLLKAELQLRAGDDIPALATLHRRYDGPFNPFYFEYQVERLAELGATSDALVLFASQGALMGDFDRLRTQTALALITGDETLARGSFRALFRQPLNATRVERIAALLVAHPQPALFRELSTWLKGQPAVAAEMNASTMWVAGVAAGADDEAAVWRQALPGRPPGPATINFASRDPLAADSVFQLVNVVPLSREVIQALLGRVAPPQTIRR